MRLTASFQGVMEFENLLQRVGSNIKIRRKKMGLTQKEMSQHGVGQRHMQDIESGKGNLTLKTLWKISRIFNIRVNDLLASELHETTCDAKGGLFEKVAPFIPLACIIWQHTNDNPGESYRLKFANRKAEEFTLPDLNSKIGSSLLDLFPLVDTLGFVAFLNAARQSGKPMVLENFLYGDQQVKFGHFAVTAVPICNDEIVVFFDVINEKVLIKNAALLPTQFKSLE